MMKSATLRRANVRKFLPLGATVSLFILAFLAGTVLFTAMRDGQSFFHLFITTPFLLILVVGEGLVIISGGIDLSVGGVVALTTVASAALLADGWDPLLVIPLMLVMGLVFGAVMGLFIAYLKVQPFIATLAGMWLARGLCYVISDSEIRIYDPLYKLLAGTRILIPGLADPATKKGDYVTVLVVVAVLVLAVGTFLAHYTQFGRTIYAMGGNNGANEQSARLMGLHVDRTKVQVYMVSGFCSALAGIAYSIYVGSGHGTHATGMELTVIAAVVIGGMPLTGGEGYLVGGLFGVLITALIQSLIQFNGQLSSWWTSIVIGALMLVFIGVQSLLSTMNARQLTARRLGTTASGSRAAGQRRAFLRDRRFLIGAAVVVVALGAVQVIGMQDCDQRVQRRQRRLPAEAEPAGSRRRAHEGGCSDRLRTERRGRLRRRAVRDLRRWTDRRGQRHADGGEEGIAGRCRRDAREHQRPRVVHRQHVLDVAHPVRPVLLVLHDGLLQRTAEDGPGSRRGDRCSGQVLADDRPAVHARPRVRPCSPMSEDR